MVTRPPQAAIREAVEIAVREDVGLAGDLTTAALVDPDQVGRASITFRDAGVLAGTWTTDELCGRFDMMVAWSSDDGDVVAAGESVGEIEGVLADMLTAERTLLNFLSHLSGIATLTREFVDAASDADVLVRDTRKTTPGLRALEKAAVRAGGGLNHRFGLYDAILVKDNHLAALGEPRDMAAVVEAAMRQWPGVVTEVEAETVEQAVAAADAGCDLVLVDNMTPAEVAEAVKAIDGNCAVEISGGVTLDNVDEYANCGADYIAVGAITHSAPSIDIGVDFQNTADDAADAISDMADDQTDDEADVD